MRGFVVAISLALLALTSIALASSGAAPGELKVACAATHNGLLRYVTSASKCDARREQAVRFTQDATVYTCAAPVPAGFRAVSAEDRRGQLRRVSGPGQCGAGGFPMTLPAAGRRSFCVDEATSRIRHLRGGTPCHAKTEFKVILPGRGNPPSVPPGPPVTTPPVTKPEPEVPSRRPPTANDDAATTSEDAKVSIAVLANDTDPHHDALRVASLDTTGTKGKATIAADDTVTYDPNGAFEALKPGQTATDTFSYVASDGHRESAPAKVTVTITGVNDAPVAHDDAATTPKNAAKTIAPLANDTDVDGDALHVGSIDTSATHGHVTINPDQTVTYDPNHQFDGLAAGQTAHDTFTYTASDGTADSGPATVDVTVTGFNQAPVLSGIESSALAYGTGDPAVTLTSSLAVDDPDSASLDGATVAIGAGYVDGQDTLSFADANGITGSWDHATGTLTLSGSATLADYQSALRAVTYSASDPTPSGTRTVSFQVDDGSPSNHASNVISRDIAVTHVNHAPVAHDDTASTTEDGATAITVLANDTDSDADALHVASVDTTGTTGTVTINPNGTISYDPNGQFDSLAPGDTANDSFTYIAADASGAESGPATVDVTITGLNDAPVLGGIESSPLAYDTGSGESAVTSTITAGDVDSANLQGAVVTISSGYVEGEDTLSFSPASGISGSWNPATGILTLTGSATLADYQAALRQVTYSASDPTPSGSRTIAFTVTDDEGAHSLDSNLVSRDITVTHVNHAPVAHDDTASTSEDAATAITVLANDTDADADALQVASVDTTGTKGTVQINPDGTIAYDPNGQFEDLGAGDSAHDTFTYRANDGTTDGNAATVDVTITGVNDAPVLSAIESSALAYDTGSGPSAVTSTVAAADVDSAQLTTAVVSISAGYVDGKDTLSFAPANGISGSWDATTGVLTLTGSASVADYQAALRAVRFATDATTPSGSRTITAYVDDGAGQHNISNAVSRDITVTHANHAPTANDDTATTSEDAATAPISVLANDTDVDGDTPLHVASVDTTSTAGTATLNGDGTISYDPNGKFDALGAGATAHDTFTYRAADPSNADSAPGTVDVTVTGVNDAPVLAAMEGTTQQVNSGDANAISSSLTAGDVDSANLSGATVWISAGLDTVHQDVLSFAGANGITGSYDGATGTLTLSGSSSVAHYEAALRSVQYASDVTAPDGDRAISFRVTDDEGAHSVDSNVLTRAVHVTHVNRAPVAGADSYSGALGNTKLAVGTTSAGPVIQISGDVLANDSDPDGPHSSLTASAVSPTPSGARVSMSADGSFTYVPPQGFTGTDAFSYTVSDNDPIDPKTATGSVTVAVAGPVIWYVDNAVAGPGDGRSDSPLSSLSPLTTGGALDTLDGTGDRIFVYQGSGSYGGGIVLEGAQQLIGQPQGLLVSGHQLVAPGGTNPVVTNTSGDGIALAEGAAVQRVNVSATSGAGVRATSVGNATIGSATTIAGATGPAVAVSGTGSGANAGGTIDIASTITNSAGPSVTVQSRPGGTVQLSGSLTDTGNGISLQSNTGATVRFTGTLSLATGAQDAFTAAGGGTVTAADPANTISTTTGRALNVTGTTIGSTGMVFRSVSAGTGAGGPPSGIVLSNTGSQGGLSVTGNGSAGSGGTIQHTTGPAIALTNTRAPSFSRMAITSPDRAGIRGSGVSGFTLTNSTISNAGESAHITAPPLDAAVAFNDTAAGRTLDGAVTITGNTLSQGYGGGIAIDSNDGTISDAQISNNTISNSQSADSPSADGISLNLTGTASTVASLTKATITSNTLNGINDNGIDLQGGNSSSPGAIPGTYGTPGSSTNVVLIQGNAIAGRPAGADSTPEMNGFGIAAGFNGRGVANVTVDANGTAGAPLKNMRGQGIGVGAAGSFDAVFKVTGNTLTPNSILGNSGIGLNVDQATVPGGTLANPTVTADISNNTVSNQSGSGIYAFTRDSNAVTKVKINNNTVGAAAQAYPSIEVDSGSNGTAGSPSVCLAAAGNTAATSPDTGFGQYPGVYVLQAATSDGVKVVGLSPDPTDATGVESFLTGQNPGSALGTGGFAGKRVAFDAYSTSFASCPAF